MGIELLFVSVWITFWVATAISHMRHHKEDATCLDTWKRWYAQSVIYLAGPEARKRLARIRARKLYLKKHPVIENSPTTSKPASTWAWNNPTSESNNLMVLPEGVKYTPRDYCEVCQQRTIFKYDYFGDIKSMCVPCQNAIRVNDDGTVRKVTTQHREFGIISANEVLESEERVRQAFGVPPAIMGPCEDKPGFRTGIDYDDIVSPAQVSYFRPSPALAEQPDEILSEGLVRARRHKIWKRMGELCDQMENEGRFDGELRAEWESCWTKMLQYDVILDRMEHVSRHDERKCACGGSLNDDNVCQRA